MDEFIINNYYLIIGLALFFCISLVGYLYEEKKHKEEIIKYKNSIPDQNIEMEEEIEKL